MTALLKKYVKGDRIIWGITFVLLVFSIPAVYSASAMISAKSQGDVHFLVRQVQAVLMGLFFVFLFSLINYKSYLAIIKLLFPVVLLMLVMTLFSGVSHNNAKRWIELPFVGIEIQTSEIAKIALIIFVSAFLATKKNDELINKRNEKIATWIFVLTVGLIFPADLSSALMISAIIILIMFVAGVKVKNIYIIVLIAIGVSVLYVLLAEAFDWPGRLSTWTHRMEVFFGNNDTLSSDETYQADIAKMAIVNGGFWGQGMGNGTVRYLLPQSHSDFIFAFILEEYGTWMAALISLLYLALLYRGIRIARKTNSLFAAYLALGLTFAIVLQAFINIGVSVGALPVTGQTLPLISMGRTSMIVTSFSLGIILNISKSINKDFETQEEVES